MQLQLAEDQLVVDRHLEAPLTSRAQGHVDHHWGPSPEDLNRQTDGLFQVVSGNAVFDRDAVLGIDHVPSVSAIPTDGGRRSGQGTDQAVDGRADAVGLTQFCERLRVPRCGRPYAVRFGDGRDTYRDTDATRALNVAICNITQLAAAYDAVEVLEATHQLRRGLLPHAGHTRQPVRRVASQHRVVPIRTTRDAVATLDLGLIDDQKVADSLLRVEHGHVRIAHQRKEVAVTGDDL